MFLVTWSFASKTKADRRTRAQFYYRLEHIRETLGSTVRSEGSMLFTDDRGFATRVHQLASRFGSSDLFFVETLSSKSKSGRKKTFQEPPDKQATEKSSAVTSEVVTEEPNQILRKKEASDPSLDQIPLRRGRKLHPRFR